MAPPSPPGGAIGGSGPTHCTEQSADATHWPAGSHIWSGGHWNSATHMSGHAIPISTPHVRGHMLPQSVQTCPPQSAPRSQAAAGVQSAPKEDKSCSRSLTSTLPSPLTSEPSLPFPPKPERRDRRSFTLRAGEQRSGRVGGTSAAVVALVGQLRRADALDGSVRVDILRAGGLRDPRRGGAEQTDHRGLHHLVRALRRVARYRSGWRSGSPPPALLRASCCSWPSRPAVRSQYRPF